MSLTIDNPEVERLAEWIAEKSSVSVERAVLMALRDHYELLKNTSLPPERASLEELEAMRKRIASQLQGPLPDHGELIYDEHGLPK